MHVYGRGLWVATLMVGIVLLAYGSAAFGQAADPVIGTWKLDVAKSKFSPGPAPKSLTAKFEAAEKGVKLTTAAYDGKDYPLIGSPVADTVSLKRINASTSERTDKKGGKVVQTLTRKMSKDGKSFTVTIKGTDPPVNNVLMFAKQ